MAVVTEFAAALATVLGGPVRDLTRLKGGYSRRMWSFEASQDGAAPSQWILCTDAEDGVVGANSLSRPTEAALLSFVHGHGLPVPAIAASGSGPEPFGASWFVMSRLSGTAAVGPLVRDPEVIAARRSLGRQKAQILARVHGMVPPVDILEAPSSPAASAEVERWSSALHESSAAQTATMKAAQGWLKANAPEPPTRLCIVHGDYRTGNLLYDHTGVLGVLDWEMAHLGDPLEDVAFAQLASWRVGTGLVGAMITDDEWIGDYETASGRRVHPDSLRFWQVLTGLKMSLLAWRAFERTGPGKERDLLHVLLGQLQRGLDASLADEPGDMRA